MDLVTPSASTRLAGLLPSCVAVVVATSHRAPPFTELAAVELASLDRAVPTRRAEFATGRACAHAALRALGVTAAPITVGDHREPVWPTGIVGSISHCGTWCAAAVAAAADIVSLGIDLAVAARLPDGTDQLVLTDRERVTVRDLAPSIAWDAVVFSAKESVYKAWFPTERSWLDFEDVEIHIEPATGAFVAEFTSRRPTIRGRQVDAFDGRFDVSDGMVMTAVSVPRVN